MPQIPTLQNQVSQQAAPNIQVRPLENTVAQSVGAGLSNFAPVATNLGNDVKRLINGEKLKTDRAAFMDADRQTDTAANDLLTQAQSLQGKDAIGSAPKLLDQFDKATTATAATLPSSRSRDVYLQSAVARRAQLQRALDNHEGQQREAYYDKSRSDYMDQAHINAESSYRDPAVIESEIGKIRAAVDQTPGLDEAQKATEFGVRRSGVYTGVIQRYLANDQINAAEKYYQSIKGNVNGDKAAYIENAITDAKRIAEARARVLTDRREAQAERAYAQAERQVSSGVPMKPEMWIDLQNKVRGTSVAPDFQSLVDGEKEIQSTLRAPIPDQVRLIQEKQAEIDKGGTLAQAANLDRLKSAFRQNMATIQNAPLLYGEQRLGDANQPIDITNIVDPSKQGETAATLQDRATRLRGLQKTLGTAVPMKPLLPQEAQQLVSTLDAASPQQSAAIFSSLRNASGSTDVFKGAMSQIAPDQPVKAWAGLLAASQADLTTGHSWFSPDPSVKSTDVAATLLRGDRLLNPSKSDKAEDGKSKTARLLLPEAAQVDLQQKFADEVGNAFAGRTELADRAYQAVQAYYVGRADQLGKLSENAQNVNSGLVREAVRNTLGNVVNYNGNGRVLAPWGMASHDFEDRVDRAFQQQAKALNLPESITPQLSNFGLVNTNQDGQYAIKLGEKFLYGPRGNVITLDIKPPDPRDRTGYIDRSSQQ